LHDAICRAYPLLRYSELAIEDFAKLDDAPTSRTFARSRTVRTRRRSPTGDVNHARFATRCPMIYVRSLAAGAKSLASPWHVARDDGHTVCGVEIRKSGVVIAVTAAGTDSRRRDAVGVHCGQLRSGAVDGELRSCPQTHALLMLSTPFGR